MDRIGDQIGRELARSGSRDAIPLSELTAAWPEVAGPAVARNAWPLRLARDGTLHVATASATWAHELDLLQETILEGFRARLGDTAPVRLRFAAGPVPEPAGAEAPPGALSGRPVEVPEEIASEAAAAAAEIDDEELRELVSRAARASLLKARSGRSFW
jgi:predicted nucleic acid-binding Zn ribbon protein